MGSKVYDEILEEGITMERRSLLEKLLIQRLGDRVRPILSDIGRLRSETHLSLALQIVAIPDNDQLLAEINEAIQREAG